MKIVTCKKFANGAVYLLKTEDGYPVETTDTFLPYYTKNAVGRKQNALTSGDIGSRSERWMVGVSTMSGCPVRCKFCATAQLKKWRNLTAQEIIAQVCTMVCLNGGYEEARKAREFKINYTRMGEPFLNIEAVREAIAEIDGVIPNAHHYVSTIGIQGSDFSWVKDDITLQISLHSFDEKKRNWLIPYNRKMTIPELGQIRTQSHLKTTLNLTLVDETDFDIGKLRAWFDPEFFFIKLSPLNENMISNKNGLSGIIHQKNLM